MTRRLEAAAWLYMRLSGVALLVLVLGHVLLMHVLVGVDNIDFAFVQARWTGWAWRTYDLAMLLLAMAHAANGIRGLAREHIPNAIRHTLTGTAYALCLAVTALGAWVILTFPNPL